METKNGMEGQMPEGRKEWNEQQMTMEWKEME